MIAAAREAGEPHTELQARNWRVTDLFELGDMPACREEMARHARLADELRLPVFQWYAPLWEGVLATLAGRYEDAARLLEEAERAGRRAGDANAELFPLMAGFLGQIQRREFAAVDLAFVEDKIANSPAGPAYRFSHAWTLAARGETERARDELDAAIADPTPFDANWLSAQAESAEACIELGDAAHAQVLYDRLAPYAGRPATAGRAATSYGAVDLQLGGLADLLGRRDDALRHLRDAVRRNEELGCTAWRALADERLSALR
jgi:tetratricopeptide (TPR) repeat protein